MESHAAACATLWRLLHLVSSRPGGIAASNRDKPVQLFPVRCPCKGGDVNGAARREIAMTDSLTGVHDQSYQRRVIYRSTDGCV